MPVGTITTTTERFDLKTLPEAYVVVRRMTYGEKLKRQDELFQMRATKDSEGMDITMFASKVALRDFSLLVIEHNITDANERLLNFKDAKDVSALDPRIGDEIGQLIDSINAFEETTETKN